MYFDQFFYLTAEIKGMPRKPRRSGQLVPRPFAFSPFARSVTRVATACSSKDKVSISKSDRTSKLLGVFSSNFFPVFEEPCSFYLCFAVHVTFENLFYYTFSADKSSSKHSLRENDSESETSEEEAPEVRIPLLVVVILHFSCTLPFK